MDMKIKELREKSGLSQADFSKKYEIPLRTLQQWEQGRSEPKGYILHMMNIIESRENRGPSYVKKLAIEPKDTWKICIDEPFLNCERIYPIQQRKVKMILDELVNNEDVISVTVFGSSVTNYCHIGSDVDIYVEVSRDGICLKDNYDFEYDFWTNYTVDDRLKKEIYSKGVVVYDKKSNLI